MLFLPLHPENVKISLGFIGAQPPDFAIATATETYPQPAR
jgi:hypothetical protein